MPKSRVRKNINRNRLGRYSEHLCSGPTLQNLFESENCEASCQFFSDVELEAIQVRRSSLGLSAVRITHFRDSVSVCRHPVENSV